MAEKRRKGRKGPLQIVYDSQGRLWYWQRVNIAKGTARIPAAILHRLGLKTGDVIFLHLDEKTATVTIRKGKLAVEFEE